MFSEAFLSVFREKAASFDGGLLSYRDFINLALYHPEVGYYRRSQQRVGSTERADFYTAVSLGPLFGRLVVAAVKQLLGVETCARSTFVEIGAEPEHSLLDGVEHPFAAVCVLRRGDPLAIPKQAVVFANELLDAQPFHRLCFYSGRWRERGVRINPDPVEAALEDALLPRLTPEVEAILDELPSHLPEGCCLDLPLPAEALLEDIVASPWEGLWLTFDYGKSLNQLLATHPHGTARTYRRHRVSDELLKYPGESDITCHLCWDRLKAVLLERSIGFVETALGCEAQERFFMAYACETIEAIMAQGALQPFVPEVQILKQLLHPSQMGRRFQAFWGLRQRKDREP